MIDSREHQIDQEMKIFDRFSHPQPDQHMLQQINASTHKALRHRRRMRMVIRLTGIGAIAASVALILFLDIGSLYTTGQQAASLEQLVDQFISAADSCQLAGVTSEIDQQIIDLEDQVTQWQSLSTGSIGMDGQLNQLEVDVDDFADSV